MNDKLEEIAGEIQGMRPEEADIYIRGYITGLEKAKKIWRETYDR